MSDGHTEVSCLQIMEAFCYCSARLIARESDLTQLTFPALETSVGGQTSGVWVAPYKDIPTFWPQEDGVPSSLSRELLSV